ncbi:hypothetical protein D3C81_1311940 [compost metagenome]
MLHCKVSDRLVEINLDLPVAHYNIVNYRKCLWLIDCHGNRNLNVKRTIVCSDCCCTVAFCFDNTVHHFSYT